MHCLHYSSLGSVEPACPEINYFGLEGYAAPVNIHFNFFVFKADWHICATRNCLIFICLVAHLTIMWISRAI